MVAFAGSATQHANEAFEIAVAQRDRAAANLKAAEANLRRAESDLDRLEQAVRTNAVSQQEVTRARAERDQASAAVLQAQAELTNAEIQLAYTSVTSPIAGIIGRNLVDEGNLVGPGSATLLARVIRRIVGPETAVIDSATATASALASLIEIHALGTPAAGPGRHRMLTTGDVSGFATTAALLFGEDLGEVEGLELGAGATAVG